MKFLNFFKTKKLLLANILLTFYIATNLIGGERGLVSFYEKERIFENLIQKEIKISKELNEFEKRNQLLSSNLNLDYVDMIYREKFKFGKKDEIIIKLR
tara:strand:+ start:773 stop:1069 length:297 start_codon:yes stop_codon:yes gene_type:complete